MPMWAVILTVAFSAVIMIVTVANFLKSFRFATKEDVDELKDELKEDIIRLERRVDIISERIDRHLEGHP